MENEHEPTNENNIWSIEYELYCSKMRASIYSLRKEGLISEDLNNDMLELQLTARDIRDAGLDRLDMETQDWLFGLKGFIAAGVHIELSRQRNISPEDAQYHGLMCFACLNFVKEVQDTDQEFRWYRVFERLNYLVDYAVTPERLAFGREYLDYLVQRPEDI